MASCVSCDGCIGYDDQSYLTSEMGFELYSLLPESIEQEINEDSVLCVQCFDELTRRLALDIPRPPILVGHDINQCFSCHQSIIRKRSLVLGIHDGPEHREIVRTINAQIPLNARVCYRCWFRAHRNVLRQSEVNALRNIDEELRLDVAGSSKPPPLIIPERCVLCDGSLFQRQSRILPEGQERNFISARIQPREIPLHARVCAACWISVWRILQRERDQRERRIAGQEELFPSSNTPSCYTVTRWEKKSHRVTV